MPASDAAAGPALAHQVTPPLVRLLAAGQRGQRRLEAAPRGHPDRDRGGDQEEAEGEVEILSTLSIISIITTYSGAARQFLQEYRPDEGDAAAGGPGEQEASRHAAPQPEVAHPAQQVLTPSSEPTIQHLPSGTMRTATATRRASSMPARSPRTARWSPRRCSVSR